MAWCVAKCGVAQCTFGFERWEVKQRKLGKQGAAACETSQLGSMFAQFLEMHKSSHLSEMFY